MRIEIYGSSASLLAAALREFPEYSPAPADRVAERGVIRIRFVREIPSTPENEVLQPGSHGLRFGLSAAGVRLATQSGSAAYVDWRARSVLLSLHEQAESPERDTASLLGISLPYLYRELGLFPVHSAAVLSGGTAVLLAGISGSGKSTTASLLSAYGMSWLADDVVLLDPGRGSLSLRGIARRPRLDDGSRARLEAWSAPPSDPELVEDAVVTLDENNRALLLFPYVGAETASRLHPIPRPAALDALIRCSLLLGERKPTAEHLQILASLARCSQAFQLILGEQVEALPTMIESLIQDR